MTAQTTDDTRPDTIRDAFEAILALLQMLIARKFSGLYTSAVRLGVEVGEQLDITHPHSGKSLLALRDLIQRAAEEHNRRTSAAAADMPAERIREMRERCDKATPGPWAVRDEGREGIGIDQAGINNIGSDRFILNEGANGTRADLDFAAHAREDLPAALAEIERLQGQLSMATGLYHAEQRAVIEARVKIERLKQQVDDAENDAMHAQDDLAARAPADAPSLARARAVTRLLALGLDGQEVAHLLADAASIVAGRGRLTSPGALAILADYVAPADASLEARAALRDTFTKFVHIDHMARHLCENSGIDHTKDPPEATVDVADLTALGAALDAVDPAEEHAAQQRDRLMAVLEACETSADASRPGLTEEQARAWERLRTAATTAVEAYEDSDADEAFEPLFAALDEALAGLATAEEESASRGETGPAAEPTRAERVAEAQRLRAEARAEAEACTVPMPADLLARYPRSADPPEPDRPTDLGPGIGGAPIRVRPTGAPDPRATLHAGNSPSLPDGSGVLVPHPANVLASKRGGK